MMNSQRAFWISGAATLMVLLLIGSAIWGGTRPQPATFPSASIAGSETEVLRAELAQAYSDLDQAYRTIEKLQSRDGSRRRHHEEHEEDDDD